MHTQNAMSLRARLLLAILFAIIAHAIWQVHSIINEARDNLITLQQEQGQWVGKVLERSLANAMITNDLATVQSTSELVFSKRRFQQLTIVDERQRAIIDLVGDDIAAVAVPRWFVDLIHLGAMPSRHPMNIGGVSYGEIIVHISPLPLIEQVWRETKTSVLQHLAEIIALYLLLHMALSYGLRPLTNLTATVARIGGGDLHARVPPSRTREFHGITSVINTMAGQIESLITRTLEQAASEIQARRLQAMHTITASDDNTDNKIRHLLALGATTLGMHCGLLTRFADNHIIVMHRYRYEDNTNNLEPQSLCYTSVDSLRQHDSVLGFHNTTRIPPAARAAFADSGIQAYVGASICIQGQLFGTLSFSRQQPLNQEFHLGDLEFIKLMAQWIGLALTHDQRENALWEAKERAQVTLASIGDGVITTDTQGIVTYINHIAEELTGWSQDEARGKPLTDIFIVVHEKTRDVITNPIIECLQNNKTVELAANAVIIRRDGSERAIEDSAAPIRDRNGNTLGAVLVFRDVSSSRALANQLEYFASHDQLTELPNRREFENRLKRLLENAQHSNKTHALCYIDLDQFKLVNDTCGHLAGDELLRQISTLLQTRLRGSDILARLGGDEFGLMLINVDIEQAMVATEAMLQLVRDFRFRWDNRSFTIGASVGVVMIDAQVGSLEDVMRKADIACYSVKHNGRNAVHLYQSSDNEQAQMIEEINWVTRLRQAIDNNQLQLWYQPILSLNGDNTDISMEVLLRLIETDGRVITPGTFIPAAERYGIMPEIDRWVVANAFRYVAAQQDTFSFHCSINLSGLSLSHPDTLRYINQQIVETGVNPRFICFEITETAAISNLAQAIILINELTKIGFRFALDDFGTGLSSFAYLKHLPVHYLKIDGTFITKLVEDPLDQAMVQAINQIAHVMGKQTIAEFVENTQIMNKLKLYGVDYAQGYGIGRPRPLEEATGQLPQVCFPAKLVSPRK